MATSRPIDLCTRSYFISPGTFFSSVSNALNQLGTYMQSQHGHEQGCHEAVGAIQECAQQIDTLLASAIVGAAVTFVHITVACASENHNSWQIVEYLERVKNRIGRILDPPRYTTYIHYQYSALGQSGLSMYLPNSITLLGVAFTEITENPQRQIFSAPVQALINLHAFLTDPELAQGHIPVGLQSICDMYYLQLFALFERWRHREDAQRVWYRRRLDGEEYRYWVLLAHLVSPIYYHPDADLVRLDEPLNQFGYHSNQLEKGLMEAAFNIDAAMVLEQLESTK